MHIPSTTRISIKQAFRFSWRTCIANLRFFVPIIVGFILLGAIADMAERHQGALASFGNLLASVAQFVLMIGVINLSLRLVRKESITWRDLWVPSRILPFLAASITFAVPFIIALLAYVVFFFRVIPHGLLSLTQTGIVVSTMGIYAIIGCFFLMMLGFLYYLSFFFYQIVAVDEGLWPLRVFKRAREITRDNRRFLVVFLVVLGVFNILGAMTIIGLFITVPLSLMMTVYVYERLRKHALGQSSEFPVPQPPEIAPTVEA